MAPNSRSWRRSARTVPRTCPRKGSLRVYDHDHLVFMNMASPVTVANLRRDAHRGKMIMMAALLSRSERSILATRACEALPED